MLQRLLGAVPPHLLNSDAGKQIYKRISRLCCESVKTRDTTYELHAATGDWFVNGSMTQLLILTCTILENIIIIITCATAATALLLSNTSHSQQLKRR